MQTIVYELGKLENYKYVVIISEYKGGILLSRHKDRTTWETQGGHIENDETPMQAARRELYEESGAVDFMIKPLCDYRVENDETHNGDNGIVFIAKIRALSEIPESEMAEVGIFDKVPDNLTYPQITPKLLTYFQKYVEREGELLWI